MGASRADYKKKKKLLFWSAVFSYCMQQQWTIYWLDCDIQWKVDFLRQPETISSVAEPRRSSKEFPKSNLYPKKVMVSVWWSNSGLIYYSFLNHGETVHLRSMLSKSMRAPKTAIPAIGIGQQKGPNSSQNAQAHILQPKLQKLNTLGYRVLPHPPYSPDFSATNYHFLKYLDNFLQLKCFQDQHEAENVFQEFIESWSMDFYTTRIKKLSSHCKNVLILMVPILINIDVFEPSYNDLKFTIWNCNYIWPT